MALAAARPSPWLAGGLLAALVVALPVVTILLSPLLGGSDALASLVETVLPLYLRNTLALMLGAMLIAGSIGVICGWLVARCDFPGRRWLSWALVLPLAVPAYIIAYAYTDLLDFAGPVQTGLRALTGWAPRDYWFPRIRSLPGASLMLGLVLYPYVYLLARSAFASQSATLIEAARGLGQGPLASFWRVALPVARPALVGGLALVMMETIADFGTVAHFNVPVLTNGIYRAWFGQGQPVVAAQLAACLFVLTAALVWLERSQRQGRASSGRRASPARPATLSGPAAWLATLACTLPVLFGFAVPALRLGWLSVTVGDPLWGVGFVTLALNASLLGLATALLALLLAVLLGYAQRLDRTGWSRAFGSFATLGYALPGSVVAIGVLLPFSAADQWIDQTVRQMFGQGTGLVLSGTVIAVIYAYLVRFMALAFNPIQAGLEAISPAMDEAARGLGRSPGGVLRAIHLPLLRPAALGGVLLVFVEVIKELPATIILRPFDFETLATRAYRLAADERLAEASTAALLIVAISLLPVLLIDRVVGRGDAAAIARRDALG